MEQWKSSHLVSVQKRSREEYPLHSPGLYMQRGQTPDIVGQKLTSTKPAQKRSRRNEQSPCLHAETKIHLVSVQKQVSPCFHAETSIHLVSVQKRPRKEYPLHARRLGMQHGQASYVVGHHEEAGLGEIRWRGRYLVPVRLHQLTEGRRNNGRGKTHFGVVAACAEGVLTSALRN